MAFKPYTGDFSTQTIGCVASAVMVNGGLVRFDATTGYIEPAVETTICQYGVWVSASVTASATNGATTGQVIPLRSGQVWEVDTTGDMVLTYIGTYCALTDASTLNEDEVTTRPCWAIVGYTGALADNKALASPQLRLITIIGV